MSDPMTEWRRQFDAMSRQFQDAMGGSPAAAADPLSAWAAMAQPPSAEANAMLERFSKQAQDYLALMRGVAESAGGKADAAGLARAWREALAAATAGNPMLSALGAINGGGARTPEQLLGGAEAWLAPFAGQLQSWLSLPAFGPAREQQQRLQALARDQSALQQAQNRFRALLLEAGEQAFARFERKLEERSEPGRQLDSARGLYDLWIDAAEEAWSELALSPRFGQVFAALSDAQMRVRRGVQEQLERACNELGLPTRTELDSAHRRIHALTRELRALRQRVDGDAAGPAAKPAPATAPGAAKPSRRAGASKARTPKTARPRDDRAVRRADPVPAPRAPAARKKPRRKPASR